MKVIHIFNELKFSGAEIMYVDAASVFQQFGCELSAVATGRNTGEYASYFENAGYLVFHKSYPSIQKPVQRLKYMVSFIKFLKQENYNVVHIHSQRMMWTMALCAWMANIHSIYTCHNVFRAKNPVLYTYRYLTRQTAKHIFNCKFQTISNSVYDNEKNYFHNKTFKINNWYGSSRFYPAAAGEKVSARKESGISANAPVLISVGGCSHVKRHHDIIKALAVVVKKYPDILYLHLGEGASLQEERLLAEKLQVSAHIKFCGNQRDVRKFLVVSDIYIMPSKYEGSPLTTIEAMACGIPAILYDVPGLKDFSNEKECALIIDEDDSVLADSIIALYENNEKKEKLIQNAKTLVECQFNMKINAKKIFDLYQP